MPKCGDTLLSTRFSNKNTFLYLFSFHIDSCLGFSPSLTSPSYPVHASQNQIDSELMVVADTTSSVHNIQKCCQKKLILQFPIQIQILPKQFVDLGENLKFGFCLKSKVDPSWWELFTSFLSLEAMHRRSRQRKILLQIFFRYWQ